MKRLHVHLSVDDLATSVDFYTTLFGGAPAVLKHDYAKWMLDDPRVNFAISRRARRAGLDHLGIQVEDDAELAEVKARYKSLVKELHPDVTGGDGGAEERLKIINLAYSDLKAAFE